MIDDRFQVLGGGMVGGEWRIVFKKSSFFDFREAVQRTDVIRS